MAPFNKPDSSTSAGTRIDLNRTADDPGAARIGARQDGQECENVYH